MIQSYKNDAWNEFRETDVYAEVRKHAALFWKGERYCFRYINDFTFGMCDSQMPVDLLDRLGVTDAGRVGAFYFFRLTPGFERELYKLVKETAVFETRELTEEEQAEIVI
jgi:hypothetical protein